MTINPYEFKDQASAELNAKAERMRTALNRLHEASGSDPQNLKGLMRDVVSMIDAAPVGTELEHIVDLTVDAQPSSD